MVKLTSTLFASAALFSSYAAAVTPLVVRGSSFVNSKDQSRFQVIGVAYQPGGAAGYNPGSGEDPLSNADICLRDAILMQSLGMNTIRVYNLDPEIDHTPCASIFNAAGIYMILDVNSPLPNESLNRVAPWENYNPEYMERVLKIVESFLGYPNTLGFFSANEIINEDSVEAVPQYVRAVTRDIKEYLSKHADREIPVGYSAADVRPLLADTFNYFECGIDGDEWSKMDFFGLNSYSWCGDSDFEKAGYDILMRDFAASTVPVFFSEYGCNKVTPRPFTEIGAIYSDPFMGIFSGGVVYEWTQEENDYGLVKFSDSRLDLLEDYDNLQSELAKIDVQALTRANSTATNLQAPLCSEVEITSNITSNFTVPARLSQIQDWVDNGLGGDYRKSVTTVTETSEPAEVHGSDGSALTGLSLKILGADESNLPGNNPQVTDPNGQPVGEKPSTASSDNGSGGNGENAATRSGMQFGFALVALVVAIGANL